VSTQTCSPTMRRRPSVHLSGRVIASVFQRSYFPSRMDRWDFDIQNTWNVDKIHAPADLAHSSRERLQLPRGRCRLPRVEPSDTGKARACRLITRATIRSTTWRTHSGPRRHPHLFHGNLPNSTSVQRARRRLLCHTTTALGQWVVNDSIPAPSCGDRPFTIKPHSPRVDPTIANGQYAGSRQITRRSWREYRFRRTRAQLSALIGPYAQPSGQQAPSRRPDRRLLKLILNFDGTQRTVPGGVLYLVEGAVGQSRLRWRGRRTARQRAPVWIQDDSATGMFLSEAPGLTVPQRPCILARYPNSPSPEMITFSLKRRGRRKSPRVQVERCFPSGVVVDRKKKKPKAPPLTCYQRSASHCSQRRQQTPANPTPFGTGYPRPRRCMTPLLILRWTLPWTGSYPSRRRAPRPLLDAWTVNKNGLVARCELNWWSQRDPGGQTLTYELFISQQFEYALSGTQVRFPVATGSWRRRPQAAGM